MSGLPLEHVHVPADSDHDGPVPAVFVMHGRGADEQDLLPVTEHFPDELAVVSLRAPDRLQRGYAWYEIDTSEGFHNSQPDPQGYRRSLDVVTESIETATEAYDLDSDRLGLMGFSMGSMISMGLLLESPGDYDWIAGLHGYLPESHTDLDPDGIEGKPVFLAGGSADQVIPPTRVEAAAERFRQLGADVTFDTYQVGHGVAQAELNDLVSFVSARLD